MTILITASEMTFVLVAHIEECLAGDAHYFNYFSDLK